MKKIVLAAVALILSAGSMSIAQDKASKDGMQFTEGTFAQITKKAQASKKMIFMDIYTTWCGPCKFMTSDIFPSAEVGAYANKTFVNAKFDAEKGEGIELAKKFVVKSYPTMLILNDKGEELGRLIGSSRTPAEFVKRLQDEVAKIKAK